MILDRLPAEAEACLIRRALRIYKAPAFSAAATAAKTARLLALKAGSTAKTAAEVD